MMNRLASESSPYLRQHATNPVNWFPWGDEAFAEARGRDVPVLLWPEAQAVKASANVHGRIQRVCRFFMRLRFSIRLACCLGSSGASNINDRAVSREGDVRHRP